MVSFVFDTNILIDYMKGFPEAKVLIDRSERRIISIVTWMEMLAGVTTDTELHVRGLLDRFLVVSVTPVIAEAAVIARRQRRLKLPDAIILATAESEGCQLLTRNTRDFAPDDPRIRIPYRLQ